MKTRMNKCSSQPQYISFLRDCQSKALTNAKAANILIPIDVIGIWRKPLFSQQFVVKNPTGLHARPASQLAKLCKSLSDEVRLITEKGAVNPKNVLGILTAGLKNGSQFTVQVEGESEQDSGRQIMEFLEGLSE